jgi:transposase InsO family protein
MRSEIHQEMRERPGTRLTRVLRELGLGVTNWYRESIPQEFRKRPGPPSEGFPLEIEKAVVAMANPNPWYGYKRIAMKYRRAGTAVTNRQAYKATKRIWLLWKKRRPQVMLYQTSKLFDLLPKKPNDLWQLYVTYVHIPGFGWYYVITAIDYYSRYLLAAWRSANYSALEIIEALKDARAKAVRIHGPLEHLSFLVTDNGPSFLARRFGAHLKDLSQHVRIQDRTPKQLGILERFHQTLKTKEVYWRIYENPGHARDCIAEFRGRHNMKRPNWALLTADRGDPLTPEDAIVHEVATQLPHWQALTKAAKGKLDRMLAEERTAS